MRHPFVMLIVCLAGVAPAGAQCSSGTQQLIAELKYDEARSAVEALLKKNPSDDAAMDCMGSIHMAQGKSGDGRRLVRKGGEGQRQRGAPSSVARAGARHGSPAREQA